MLRFFFPGSVRDRDWSWRAHACVDMRDEMACVRQSRWTREYQGVTCVRLRRVDMDVWDDEIHVSEDREMARRVRGMRELKAPGYRRDCWT